jgi:ubiquitin C-terminal hydrolase
MVDTNVKVNGKATSLSPDEWTYDLCGVCNHYGNMLGGHYTGNRGNAMTIHLF